MGSFYNVIEAKQEGVRENVAKKYGKKFRIEQAGLMLESYMDSEGVGESYQRITTLNVKRSFDFVISDSTDDINLTYNRNTLRKQIGHSFELKNKLKNEFGDSLKNKSFYVEYRIFEKGKKSEFWLWDWTSDSVGKTINVPKSKVSVFNIKVTYKFVIHKISFDTILEKLKKIESENGRLYKSINIFWKDESTKIIGCILSTDIYEKVFNKSFYRTYKKNERLIKTLEQIGLLSTMPLLLITAIGWFSSSLAIGLIYFIGLVTLLISIAVGFIYFKSEKLIKAINDNYMHKNKNIYVKNINDKLMEMKSHLDNY